MKPNKSWKTTLVGVICLANVFISLILVYFHRATLDDVKQYLTVTTPVIAGIAAIFAKDSNVSGTSNQPN
jgi:hypothetical protein